MTYVPTKLNRKLHIDQIITIHYFEYMKDFIFKGERHDFWEFMYVDKGSVNVYTDDSSHLINTGDIIFHKPNEFHAMKSVGGKAPNLVAISFICKDSSMDFFANKVTTLNDRERELISLIIFEARHGFSTPLDVPMVEQIEINHDAPFGSSQLILNYIEILLIAIRRNHSPSDLPVTQNPPVLHSISHAERIRTVIAYMDSMLTEPLTVTDLCTHFSVSKSSIQDLFKSEKGMGVMEFFNQMKIELAKELIRSKAMTITEIAFFLSYSSPQYFSKRFKKQTGMSPYEYSQSVKDLYQKMSFSKP